MAPTLTGTWLNSITRGWASNRRRTSTCVSKLRNGVCFESQRRRTVSSLSRLNERIVDVSMRTVSEALAPGWSTITGSPLSLPWTTLPSGLVADMRGVVQPQLGRRSCTVTGTGSVFSISNTCSSRSPNWT